MANTEKQPTTSGPDKGAAPYVKPTAAGTTGMAKCHPYHCDCPACKAKYSPHAG
jgi:hypothetical protein